MATKRETLLTEGKPLFVTYDKAFALVRNLEPEVAGFAPELIVGVLRSGLIPALMLSQRITVPVAFCACNRGDTTARFLDPQDVHGKRVLIVDDFASTGATLAKVRAMLEARGAVCRSLAIFYDAHLATPPDFGHKAAVFIQFIWDKLEVTPSSRRLFASQDSRYAPDAVTEYFGVDVDGLILNRPAADSDKVRRHLLQKRSDAVVLVTAKAAGQVRATLEALGLGHLTLVGAETTEAAETAVSYKARQIRACGISTFYEADTEDALGIAQACPITDVVLWNTDTPVRINVDALRAP